MTFLLLEIKFIVDANVEARSPPPASHPSQNAPNPKDQHQQDLHALGQEVLDTQCPFRYPITSSPQNWLWNPETLSHW